MTGPGVVRRWAASVLAALLLAAALGQAPPIAAAPSSDPTAWASACAHLPGLDKDTLALAPAPLTRAPDTTPGGAPVVLQPDARGTYTPVIMVHGWTGQDTHDNARAGAFSHLIDLTANRLGSVTTTRSLIGQLQGIAGTAVFTFDYRDYAASWVDDNHLGPALGKVIDCLFQQSGQKVIVVGHSMGGLAARYAASTPGIGGAATRAGEISTVVTFGTPETGSVAALLTSSGIDAASRAYKPLAVLRWILAACGRLSSSEIVTGTLCDQLPAPARAFASDAGIALRSSSVQLAALKPFPPGVSVDTLAGNATFEVPGGGWFALPWSTTAVPVGDLVVTAGSALDKVTTGSSPLSSTVTCGYQLNPVRGGLDTFGLKFGLVSKADVAQQPLAAFAGPCFHIQLMRSIELTNEATGAVADDVAARQPKPITAVAMKVPSIGLKNYQTSGAYPQLTGGTGGSLTAVNAALRNQVLADQQSYRDTYRQTYGTDLANSPYPGTYELSFTPKLMTVSPTVMSTMYPSLELYPGGNDGSGWLSLTTALPDGKPLAVTDLLTPGSGLPALSAVLLQQLRATNGCAQQVYADTSDFGQISRDQIARNVAPTVENYRNYALTRTGLDVGLDQGAIGAEACGSVRTTLPWAKVRPLLNATGQRLLAGLE